MTGLVKKAGVFNAQALLRAPMLKSLLAIFRAKPTADLTKLKPLCTGAETGLQCQHYWLSGHLSGRYQGQLSDGTMITLDDNPEFRRTRQCNLVSPSVDLGGNPKAVCNHYAPSARPFAADLEVEGPKELDLPSMLEGGGVPGVEQLLRISDATTDNSSVKDWDKTPGGPFVHAEVASHKTACSVKAPDRKLAALGPPFIDGQASPSIQPPTCPGCLAVIAERPDVIAIATERAQQVAEFNASEVVRLAALAAVPPPPTGDTNG